MDAIASKQKQTFSINAPTALSVLLVGDFTRWQQNPIPPILMPYPRRFEFP
jgi:hypothetical protein